MTGREENWSTLEEKSIKREGKKSKDKENRTAQEEVTRSC